MRLSLRTKVVTILGLAVAAFGAATIAGQMIDRRLETQRNLIRDHYLPRVELNPRLVGQLERIHRGFQDAVAARDVEALAHTRALVTEFSRILANGKGAIAAPDAAAIQAAVDDYFTIGSDVSRRLIAGETGEDVVRAMADMQSAAKRADDLTESATAMDKRLIDQAFADVAAASATASRIRFWVGAGLLALVGSLSAVWGQSALASLTALSSGVQRYGRGDLAHRIVVPDTDEIGAVAREANLMAARLYDLDLEQKKSQAALAEANRELEAFSYSVAHDLRTPLRGIDGFSQILLEDYAQVLDEKGRGHLTAVRKSVRKMADLIEGLLSLAQVTRKDIQQEKVNLSELAHASLARLQNAQPERKVEVVIAEGLEATGDSKLLSIVLDNLLGNAWKFTRNQPAGRIEFRSEEREGEREGERERVFEVRDNGAGFDMAYVGKLFGVFQRLHGSREFEGSGIGLATVQRIIRRHGGRIWATGKVDQGARFCFTLGQDERV